MSYDTALANGANIVFNANQSARADRLMDNRETSQPMGMQPYPRQRTPVQPDRGAESAAFQQEQRGINMQMQKNQDLQAEAEKEQTLQQQATAWDRAVMGLGLGATKPIVEYLNRFGDPNLPVGKIERSPDGKLTVYPDTSQGSAVVNGKDYPLEQTKAQFAPITFASDAEFYSKVLGQRKPEGAKAQIAQPEKSAQDWVFGADGTRAMEKNSGRIKETGYVKTEAAGSGSGSSGSSGGSKGKGPDKAAWDRFDDQYNKQFVAAYLDSLPEEKKQDLESVLGSDALGGARVDMDQVFAKSDPELRKRYNSGRQLAEMWMTDSNVEPFRAANKAVQEVFVSNNHPDSSSASSAFSRIKGGEMADDSAEKVMKALSGIPDVPTRIEQAKRFLASDAPDDVKEKVRYQVEAQLAQVQAVEGRKDRQAQYTQRMAASPSSMKVRDQMFTKLSQSVPDYSAYDIPVVKQGLQGLDQVAHFFFIDPVRAGSSDIAGLLRGFQSWARAGGFNSRQQAVKAFAEENPQAAQQIASAAQPKTPTRGMKP